MLQEEIDHEHITVEDHSPLVARKDQIKASEARSVDEVPASNALEPRTADVIRDPSPHHSTSVHDPRPEQNPSPLRSRSGLGYLSSEGLQESDIRCQHHSLRPESQYQGQRQPPSTPYCQPLSLQDQSHQHPTAEESPRCYSPAQAYQTVIRCSPSHHPPPYYHSPSSIVTSPSHNRTTQTLLPTSPGLPTPKTPQTQAQPQTSPQSNPEQRINSSIWICHHCHTASITSLTIKCPSCGHILCPECGYKLNA